MSDDDDKKTKELEELQRLLNELARSNTPATSAKSVAAKAETVRWIDNGVRAVPVDPQQRKREQPYIGLPNSPVIRPEKQSGTGEPITIIYVGADPNRAMTTPVREGDPNSATLPYLQNLATTQPDKYKIVHTSGKTPEQVKEQAEQAAGGRPVNVVLLMHGYKGDADKPGGVLWDQKGKGKNASPVLMSYGTLYAGALPSGVQSVYNLACHGEEAQQQTATRFLPKGVKVGALSSSQTVSWGTEVQALVEEAERDGNFSADAMNDNADRVVDPDAIVARNKAYLRSKRNDGQMAGIQNHFATDPAKVRPKEGVVTAGEEGGANPKKAGLQLAPGAAASLASIVESGITLSAASPEQDGPSGYRLTVPNTAAQQRRELV